jgi:thioredoxin 1
MLGQLGPAELESEVAAGRSLLLELRADWCSQCRPQAQVMERIEPEYEGRVTFASLDVGEHPDFAEEHEVVGLPAFLLFSGGELRARKNGFRRAPELREWLAGALS